MEADAPATSSSNGTGPESSKKEQMTEIAMALLAQGRRHLLVSDIPSAIAALAESTQILAEHYGEQADECAESYYYYGMALLEMARTDSDVLGDAVEGGDKGEDDESSDDDEEEEQGEDDGEESEKEQDGKKTNGKAESNGGGQSSKSEGAKSSTSTNGDSSKMEAEVVKSTSSSNGSEEPSKEEGSKVPATASEEPKPSKELSEEKPEDIEMKEDDKAIENPVTEEEKNGASPKPKKESKGKSLKVAGSSAGAASSEATAEDGAEEDDTGDEVTNLQLAWEVFELAKNIFQRKAETDPSAKPRLADSLVRLAEVAIESENYASAIEDLQKCLEIQTSSFPADSRSLAETYYQLGVAYTFTTEFREAVKSFESAAEVIKLRIENLKNPAEKKPSMEEPRSMFHTIEGEIEELEALLPDIKEKIADTVDLEKEALRKIAENGSSVSNGAGTSVEGEAATSATESPSKPALDITHLIRKKRKPEEAADAEAEVSAPKKVCADPVADVVAS